ncbi:MAG: transcriptional regulator MntR [Vulcanibacillus sp.]
MPTPSMEDYLEKIYQLIEKKGYARATDIAEALEVNPSSVTKMIQKLDKEKYVVYEKYRGLILTSKGEKFSKKLVSRHNILEDFLKILGLENKERIYQEVEGIEHHLSPESISAITLLVKFLEENEDVLKRLKEFHY